MNFGLEEQHFNYLKNHLIDPLKGANAEVYIFGSRALGNYKKFSDIDICFIENPAQPVPSGLLQKILIKFEDSTFPYKIDLVDYSKISANYLPGIDQSKIKI
jgi:uncharacterized protein